VHRAVCLFTSQLLVLIAPNGGGMAMAELTWVAGYIPRLFTRPKSGPGVD